MSRPPLEVADLIRAAGTTFYEGSRKWFTWLHLKILTAIVSCRTSMLGGHIDECSSCGHRAISFNSCRNRHCPKCQSNARDRWLEARRRELLPTRYAHVVFTLPHQVAPLALQNKREIYGCCSDPAQRLCLRSRAIPNISARRSDSSACCTLGINNCCTIRMFIVWSRRADWLPIIPTGLRLRTASSCPSKSSAGSSGVSL